MCVIIACRSKLPSKEDIEGCWRQNSDGAGVAWVHGGKVHFHKGLTLAELCMVQFPLPCVYHFRMATVGGKSQKLCHPFIVSEGSPVKTLRGVADRLLFHNGHINHWKPFLMLAGIKNQKGPMSDSRAIAMAVSKAGPRLLKQLSDSNKFCLLDRFGPHLYGGFHEHGGCKYSNLFWGGHWARTCEWTYGANTGFRTVPSTPHETEVLSELAAATEDSKSEKLVDESNERFWRDRDAAKTAQANGDNGSLVETASFPDWEPAHDLKSLVDDGGKDI